MAYTKRQHNTLLKQSLKKASLLKIKMDVVIIGTKCCSECDKIDGKIFPLEKEFEKPFLPYCGCTRKPFCICCYGFQVVRDSTDD